MLFGEDQLTAERARGAQRCRRNEILPEDQLRDLVPVAADGMLSSVYSRYVSHMNIVYACIAW